METPLPAPREEAGTASVADHLFVVAGFDAAGDDTGEVLVFDGRRWTAGPPLPLALDHPAVAAAQGRLYVAGGFRGGVATPGLYRLSPGLETWEDLTPLRYPRGAAGMVAVGHLLYVLGGFGGSGEVAITEVFDTDSESWSELPPLPHPRDHLAAFALRGGACAAGGRTPETARVDCYDPAVRAWVSLPDLSEPAIGAGAATLDGVPLVAGGEDGAEGLVRGTVSRLLDGRWLSEPMLVPRHGFGLAAFQDRLWACGGAELPGLHPVATCTSIGR